MHVSALLVDLFSKAFCCHYTEAPRKRVAGPGPRGPGPYSLGQQAALRSPSWLGCIFSLSLENGSYVTINRERAEHYIVFEGRKPSHCPLSLWSLVASSGSDMWSHVTEVGRNIKVTSHLATHFSECVCFLYFCMFDKQTMFSNCFVF